MESQNPYQAPNAVVRDPVQPEGELANRLPRLAAAILDTLLLIVVLSPLMYFGGYFSAVIEASQAGQQPGFGYMLVWIAIGFAVFIAVQGYPLHQSGQTWGKRAIGIKIVDLSGAKPSFGVLIGRRYLPMQAVTAVPFVGNLLALIDVLFIFRADRRCVHDLIAGTRVVRAR